MGGRVGGREEGRGREGGREGGEKGGREREGGRGMMNYYIATFNYQPSLLLLLFVAPH